MLNKYELINSAILMYGEIKQEEIQSIANEKTIKMPHIKVTPGVYEAVKELI